MSKIRFLRSPRKIAFIFIFVLAHILIFRNIYLLSRDMLLGDLSATQAIPLPRYGFERLPDTPITRQVQAQNRLAVDFAQIYFPSRQMASLDENYRSGAGDPLQRPSRYPPLFHYLCSITICKLDYGPASLLHMAVQVLLFYLVFIYAFVALKIEKSIPLGVLLLDGYLFLGPAGLSWFERGQFSLYVGAAYLLLILGFIKKNPLLILVSALFAFIKWTSFPYIAVLFPVHLFNSENPAEGRRNLLVAAGFLLAILLLTFVFPVQSLDFLKGLYQKERFALPGGISLAKILPVGVVKFLPLPLIVLGGVHPKTGAKGFARLIPFSAGAVILMLMYPTLAYEYNLPSLLGFIPLIFYWVSLPEDLLTPRTRRLLEISFFFFVFLASCSNFINHTAIIMGEYFVASALLLFVPLVHSWRSAPPARL